MSDEKNEINSMTLNKRNWWKDYVVVFNNNIEEIYNNNWHVFGYRNTDAKIEINEKGFFLLKKGSTVCLKTSIYLQKKYKILHKELIENNLRVKRVEDSFMLIEDYSYESPSFIAVLITGKENVLVYDEFINKSGDSLLGMIRKFSPQPIIKRDIKNKILKIIEGVLETKESENKHFIRSLIIQEWKKEFLKNNNKCEFCNTLILFKNNNRYMWGSSFKSYFSKGAWYI